MQTMVLLRMLKNRQKCFLPITERSRTKLEIFGGVTRALILEGVELIQGARVTHRHRGKFKILGLLCDFQHS